MKELLMTLAAAFTLPGAAFADREPENEVLVLKNGDGAALPPSPVSRWEC